MVARNESFEPSLFYLKRNFSEFLAFPINSNTISFLLLDQNNNNNNNNLNNPLIFTHAFRYVVDEYFFLSEFMLIRRSSINQNACVNSKFLIFTCLTPATGKKNRFFLEFSWIVNFYQCLLMAASSG